MNCRWCGKVIGEVISNNPKVWAYCDLKCVENSNDAEYSCRRYGLESKELEEVLKR